MHGVKFPVVTVTGNGDNTKYSAKTMDSTKCPKHLRSCHNSKSIIVSKKNCLKRPGQMEKESMLKKTQAEALCSFHHHHMSCSTFILRFYDTCHPKTPLKAWLTLQTTSSCFFLSLQKFIYFPTILATPIFLYGTFHHQQANCYCSPPPESLDGAFLVHGFFLTEETQPEREQLLRFSGWKQKNRGTTKSWLKGQEVFLPVLTVPPPEKLPKPQVGKSCWNHQFLGASC